MKDITEKFYAAIEEEIKEYPLQPHEPSRFRFGLERAMEIISIVDARETHRERVTGQVYESDEPGGFWKDYPYKPPVENKEWLLLPCSKEIVNMSQVREIGTNEYKHGYGKGYYYSVVLYYKDGSYKEHFGKDAITIFEFALGDTWESMIRKENSEEDV